MKAEERTGLDSQIRGEDPTGQWMLVIRVVNRNRIGQHTANSDHLVFDPSSEILFLVIMARVERPAAEATGIHITGTIGHAPMLPVVTNCPAGRSVRRGLSRMCASRAVRYPGLPRG